MKYKPHHTALTVKNTDETIAWYQEKLGFTVTHRYNKHGMEITIMELDDVRLEIFWQIRRDRCQTIEKTLWKICMS